MFVQEKLLQITAWHITNNGYIKKTEHVIFPNDPFQFNFTPIALSVYDTSTDIRWYENFDDFGDNEEEE